MKNNANFDGISTEEKNNSRSKLANTLKGKKNEKVLYYYYRLCRF